MSCSFFFFGGLICSKTHSSQCGNRFPGLFGLSCDGGTRVSPTGAENRCAGARQLPKSPVKRCQVPAMYRST